MVKEGETPESQPDPAPPEKEPTKMTPKEMTAAIMKEVRTCVGDECNKIRAEVSKMEPGTLTDAQLKALTHDLHEKIGGELKSSFDKDLKSLNVRTSQYGNKVDASTQAIEAHTEELKKGIEGVGVVAASIRDMERARAERVAAAAEAEVSAKAEPPLAPTIEECPSCNYKNLTVKPKITMGCPTCKVGYTSYETDPPKDDDTGGQGYKFCATCGTSLVPAKSLVEAAEKAKKAKEAIPP